MQAAVPSGVRGAASAAARKVSGTWDFKWLPGTTVRLAFQRPEEVPEREFRAARAEVLSLGLLWLSGVQGKKPRIYLEDTGIDFAPPDPSERARLNRGSLPSEGTREYDVLISLATLPTQRVDPGTQIAHRIPMPASDLGSFARRVDYGAPTVYLGPWWPYAGSLACFYAEPLVRCMVLHEFGHVLGLAHEHQNPKARRVLPLRYKDAGSIIRLINARVRGNFSEEPWSLEMVRTQILETWPGREEFSDWREYAPGDRIDSVMTHPGNECALEDNGHESCLTDGCPEFLAAVERMQAPTDSDRAHLLAMYGTR